MINLIKQKNSIVNFVEIIGLESLTNEKDSSQNSVCTSGVSQIIISNSSNELKPKQTSLASRNLTIFAIEEKPHKIIKCARKLRRRVYSGCHFPQFFFFTKYRNIDFFLLNFKNLRISRISKITRDFLKSNSNLVKYRNRYKFSFLQNIAISIFFREFFLESNSMKFDKIQRNAKLSRSFSC